jgi:hypothetical protein
VAEVAEVVEAAEAAEREAIEDSEAMEAFVQARGCRRAAMNRYIDGVQVQCSDLAEVAAPTAVAVYNNCNTYTSTTPAILALPKTAELLQAEQARLHSGQIAWQEES